MKKKKAPPPLRGSSVKVLLAWLDSLSYTNQKERERNGYSLSLSLAVDRKERKKKKKKKKKREKRTAFGAAISKREKGEYYTGNTLVALFNQTRRLDRRGVTH
jgi:hypothetical protein